MSPPNEIAAQFAAKVAATLTTGTSHHQSEPQAPPVGATPPAEPQVALGVMESNAVPQPAQDTTAPPSLPDVHQPPPPTPPQTQPVAAPPGAIQTNTVTDSLSNGDTSIEPTKAPVQMEKDTSVTDSGNIPEENPAQQNPAEPVTVSVKSSVERTSVSATDSSASNTRETTPEVHIVPPTPVEKTTPESLPEDTSEAPNTAPEPVAEVPGENVTSLVENFLSLNEYVYSMFF